MNKRLLAELGACLVLCATVVAPALAQAEHPLRSGARVRLTLRNVAPSTVYTRILLIEPRAVMVRSGDVDTATVVSARQISRFEVSRGRHPALMWGALVMGGLLGAAIGPLLITESDRCRLGVGDARECRKQTSDEAIGAIVGALAFGILAGAVVPERWREIPLGDLFLSMTPDARIRVGLSVGLRTAGFEPAAP